MHSSDSSSAIARIEFKIELNYEMQTRERTWNNEFISFKTET